MIGIINEVMIAYSIAEKIHKSFPKISIYLYVEDNTDRGINVLRNNCNIIILDNKENLSFYQKKYSEIVFLSLDDYKNNAYYLEDEKILNAIDVGNEERVRKILKDKEIIEDTIILSNPKLLFVRGVIKDIYPNKRVIDNMDNLIELLKDKKELLEDGKGIIKIIGERE